MRAAVRIVAGLAVVGALATGGGAAAMAATDGFVCQQSVQADGARPDATAIEYAVHPDASATEYGVHSDATAVEYGLLAS
jgi:hypothetical protein